MTVTGASDAKFPEIGVEFEVKQPDGSFLLDAKKEDFHVFESGQEMTIESFIAPIGRRPSRSRWCSSWTRAAAWNWKTGSAV